MRQIAYPAKVRHEPSGFLHSFENDIKAIVQTVARPGECERYIIALRDGHRICYSQYWVKGIGIFHRAGIIHPEGVGLSVRAHGYLRL